MPLKEERHLRKIKDFNAERGGAVGPEKLEIQVYTFGSKNEVL